MLLANLTVSLTHHWPILTERNWPQTEAKSPDIYHRRHFLHVKKLWDIQTDKLWLGPRWDDPRFCWQRWKMRPICDKAWVRDNDFTVARYQRADSDSQASATNNGFITWKADNAEGQGTRKVAFMVASDAAASLFISPTAQGHIGLPVLLRKHHYVH